MGTETSNVYLSSLMSFLRVKLNNPLMGTETLVVCFSFRVLPRKQLN